MKNSNVMRIPDIYTGMYTKVFFRNVMPFDFSDTAQHYYRIVPNFHSIIFSRNFRNYVISTKILFMNFLLIDV